MTDIIERRKLKFKKSVLQVEEQTASRSIRGELAQYPLEISMNTKTVKYWLRISNMLDRIITKANVFVIDQFA